MDFLHLNISIHDTHNKKREIFLNNYTFSLQYPMSNLRVRGAIGNLPD